MTRDEIVDMLDNSGYLKFDLNDPLSFMSGPTEQSENERWQWVRVAPEEWLDILLDIAVNPPPYWSDGRTMEVDDGQYQLALFLGEWGRQRSEVWAQKVRPLLMHNQARLTILQAISEARLKECVSWLAPLVNDWQRLDSDELIWLVEAIAYSGGSGAFSLLEQMQKAVPEENDDVHKQIQIFLSDTGWARVSNHFED